MNIITFNFKVLGIRARACTRCRKFVLVKPDEPGNLELIRTFDKSHSKHTLITLDYEEIKGRYQLQEGTDSQETKPS